MTTADEAQKALEDKIITWASASSSERLRDGGAFFRAAILDFAAAVRAETLAPATRGQSAELAKEERLLRSVPCYPMEINLDVIGDELDRLRASLAAAEANADLLSESLADAGAENAELRKLCGRAAEFTSSETIHEDLEAAARGAGK